MLLPETPHTISGWLSNTAHRAYYRSRPVQYRGRLVLRDYVGRHVFAVWHGRCRRTRASVVFVARFTTRGTVRATMITGAAACEILRHVRLNCKGA